MPRYLIDGRLIDSRDPAYPSAVAAAYGSALRPRCLCVSAQPEMYVSHLGDQFFLKRMPLSADRHASSCRSAVEASSEPAITTDTSSGLTTLRVDFSLSTRSMAALDQHRLGGSGTRASPGLTLSELLSYLWEKAGLTYWHPRFEGKRSWNVVRKRLLAVARKHLIGDQVLQRMLFVPEECTDIQSLATPVADNRRLNDEHESTDARRILLAELDFIGPVKHAYGIVIKQLPEARFIVRPDLYGGACRRHRGALTLWDSSRTTRMIAIGTYQANNCTPTIDALALMLTSRHWVPLTSAPRPRRLGHRV